MEEQATPLEKPQVSPFIGLSSGLRRRFELIYNSTCTNHLFGIPYFTPEIAATSVFNFWSYFLGPIYYIFHGMWRKGLVLAVIYFIVATLIEKLPSITVSNSEIISIYGTYYFVMFIMSPLIVVFTSMGRFIWAGLFGTIFLYTFFTGLNEVNPAEFLGLEVYLALVSIPIWHILISMLTFYILSKSKLGIGVVCVISLGCLVAGLPLTTIPMTLSPALLGIWIGLMGTYDRYRTLVLQQTFWW